MEEGFTNECTAPILPRITPFLDGRRDAISNAYASRYINGPDSPCRLLLGYEALSDPCHAPVVPAPRAE